ncbi:MAG TPA: small ribosomal subunit Rsm22 family protein [Ktedonobacterales bacterium]
MELPQSLRVAITAVGERQPFASLERATAALSQAYRAEGSAGARALDSAASAAAYAVTRLPATFAALTAALLEARDRVPGWAPGSLLDAGAGPGVAVWAVSGVWSSLRQATLIERDQRMIDLGRELLDQTPPDDVALTWRQVDMTGSWGKPTLAIADLVTCAFALNEIPATSRTDVVERLWAATEPERGALALVAPGTPAGFAVIRAARDQLVAAGAHILAPCPHDRACPMPDGDWCHMAQRLARSRLHRRLKGGSSPFEDEKFSYVIASRQSGSPIGARVIRRPVTLSGHIQLELCGPEGLERRDISHARRTAFRLARDARWGSAWPADESGATPD